MAILKKQKDKWNQILRERKYRPSVFGLSVHFDWYFLVSFFFLCLLFIIMFSLNLNYKINNLLEKDFSNEVQVEKIDEIEIEKFDQILQKIESN